MDTIFPKVLSGNKQNESCFLYTSLSINHFLDLFVNFNCRFRKLDDTTTSSTADVEHFLAMFMIASTAIVLMSISSTFLGFMPLEPICNIAVSDLSSDNVSSSEAVVRRCSVKNVFLKVSQNS